MTAPYYADGPVTIWHGDCIEVMRGLPDASVDAIVTDPPYGINFMGKDWDTPAGQMVGQISAGLERATNGPLARGGTHSRGYADNDNRAFQAWCELWAIECLRVLKPGGHLLAFGGTRTFHRLTAGIEDAGFEIRDSIAWLYGSGFPKSLDVAKAIDKQRDDTEHHGIVARWLVDRMTERGITRRVLSEHFGMANGAQQWTTIRTDAAVKPRVPSVEQWAELRAWLDLPADMDAEVWRLNGRKGTPGEAWEARPITGTHVEWTDRTNYALTSRDGLRRDLPATDQAAAWQGWGTALKPAFEPIVVARKPLAGTVAANVLKWGCGALNIDGSRIGSNAGSTPGGGSEAASRRCPVHGLPHLREANAEGAFARAAGEAAGDLQPSVPLGDDVAPEEPPVRGWDLDGHPVGLQEGEHHVPAGGGSRATAVPTASGGPRASTRRGTSDRATAAAHRDGASHQRREDGQPSGELAPDGLGLALQGTSAYRAGADATEGRECPAPGCTCRGRDSRLGEASADTRYTERGGTNFAPLPGVRGGDPAGRWPANVVLDASQATVLDAQAGPVGSNSGSPVRADGTRNSSGLYSPGQTGTEQQWETRAAGASRFFYTAKAPGHERPEVDGMAHPTVKPLDLMRWLVRLVTPKGGTVLEPFAGSGTTVEACVLEGFHCIAIEREADYLPLILKRIRKPHAVGFDFGDWEDVS